MWLYIPRTYCPSSAESLDLISQWGLFFQSRELFVTLSGKPTPRPYSWRGWKTRPWMKLLSGVTLQPSTADRGLELWIQSLVASPAKTCQSQESRKESNKETGPGCSTNTAELFAKLDHDTFLSKTSQDSFLTEPCQPYSKSWPKWGSMRNGECFQRKMWEPRILENESSSWRTPSASDPIGGVKDLNSEKYKNAEAPKIKLRDQSASWATPNTMDHLPQRSPEALVKHARRPKSGKRPCNLREQVDPDAVRIYANANWPTPCSTEVRQGYQDRSRGKKGSQESLTTVVMKGLQCNNNTGPLAQEKQSDGNESSMTDQTSPQLKRRLSPTFVEWLMGMPIGWSLPIPIDQNVYKLWETGSSRLLELLH